MEHAWNNNSAA